MEFKKGTFGYDLAFLKKYHKDLILLHDDKEEGGQIIVLPAYQGRVMTSTAQGNWGTSFGWVNYEHIESGKLVENFNVYGGEERFWLGPEGGQFSIYFKKGVAFTFENWFVPKELDVKPFELISASKNETHFKRDMLLKNYAGFEFSFTVNRSIRLLSKDKIDHFLGINIPENIQTVGFESDNTLTNTGIQEWNKTTGMLSIWILSMFNADEKTTIAVPYKQGEEATLGKIVTDDYFGKVPTDRLKVQDGLILLKADGNHRSKIGVSASRALPLLASYDARNNVLTIAQFTLPETPAEYVNSLWEIQENPFAGDAVNAYNDGIKDGKQLGKFYELESSSPAAGLKPGEKIRHIHRTIHLKGNQEELDRIIYSLFGVNLAIGIDKMEGFKSKDH